MNAFQLYRFLLHAPVKEFQTFCADYDLYLSKKEVKQLQELLAATPIYLLKLPLSKQITDDIIAIIGDKKYKKLMQILQQYV